MSRSSPATSQSIEACTDYQSILAGATAKLQGQAGTQGGSVGDYVRIVTFVPLTASPGSVTLQDGNGTAITLFAGGATSLVGLNSWQVFLDLTAAKTTTPGWTIVVGANINVVVSGEFK